MQSRSKHNPDEWAILCRTNYILNEVEMSLTALGINVQRIGGPSIWDAVAVTRFLQFLSYLQEPDAHTLLNLFRLLRIAEKRVIQFINTLHRADDNVNKPVTMEQALIDNISIRSGNELLEPDEDMDILFNSLVNYFIEWRALVENKEYSTVLSGVESWFDNSSLNKKAKDQVTMAARSLLVLPERMSFKERIAWIKERTDLHKENHVKLLTLHVSKGLEFKNVWMVAVEEDVLPHSDTHDMDEERRLCYVGFTRAKDRLMVSCSGSLSAQSRFIFDAGLELHHIETVDPNGIDYAVAG